jgi:hypothetical protein
MSRWARGFAIALTCMALLGGASGCTSAVADVPGCGSIERVALIAQSVASSSYVPCISELPQGWTSGQLHIRDGQTRFALHSDRSAGHPVRVQLDPTCAVGAAPPIAPRTPGGRTYLALRAIEPRYVGTMYDIFPGGCVSYRFDFERGVHIALMAQLQSAVGLVPRHQLSLEMRKQFGMRLDP